ncbi:hypothetical protein LZ30DRAFT_265952 [Colletotrichum cereale]|nr:hypothetical protein LZ30DRAFT_265952 [Colletotrichum cereale]
MPTHCQDCKLGLDGGMATVVPGWLSIAMDHGSTKYGPERCCEPVTRLASGKRIGEEEGEEGRQSRRASQSAMQSCWGMRRAHLPFREGGGSSQSLARYYWQRWAGTQPLNQKHDPGLMLSSETMDFWITRYVCASKQARFGHSVQVVLLMTTAAIRRLTTV